MSGCGPSAEQREARQLVARLDRIADAEPPQRAELLAQLDAQPATGERAEQARLRCLKSYRALDEGSALARSLPSPDAGLPPELSEDPAKLLAKLQLANSKLKEARMSLPMCRQAIRALRRLADAQ